jgi:preprotein translocase subunit SecA
LRKRRKSGQRFTKPDDYFAWGPFEIARFGKNLIWKSHATATDIAAVQDRAFAHYPVVVAEIDALVSSIAARIACLPPARLLHRAWWEYATTVVGFGGKKTTESDQLDAMQMIDYVQSVIVAVKPESHADDVSEDEWNTLKTDVATLFHRLALEYHICATAHRRARHPGMDMHLEEFRFRAEILWMNVRGKRYPPHDLIALLDVIAPHSEALEKLFGIEAAALVGEFDKILTNLTRGLADAVVELQALRDETLGRAEALSDNDGGAGHRGSS